MKKVLVLCTGNSCRSQIAHGFLNFYTDESVNIYSAGIEKHGLNANAVKSMKEVGIDISAHTSNKLDEYLVNGTIEKSTTYHIKIITFYTIITI